MNSRGIHSNGGLKTLALASSTPRVRIADILSGEEEGFGRSLGGFAMDGGDGTTSLQCSSPRRIIGRCLAALKTRRRALFWSGKVDDEGARESSAVNDSSGVESPAPAPAPASEDLGRCRTDASFNLGLACGLVFLMGASKNEMRKMIEVRTQMETLLRNFREEFQNNNVSSKPIDPFADSTLHNSHVMDSPCTTSYVVPESETILERDDASSHCYPDEQEQYCTSGMHDLEADLEAELELLEINLDTGHSSKCPQQQISLVIMDTSSESLSPSYGEVIINPYDTHTEMQTEVSPIELERKLHELLEARQQERILELEEELEVTKRKLREKEIEVSWWKDTARIISHHIPDRSPVVSEQNPKTLRLLS